MAKRNHRQSNVGGPDPVFADAEENLRLFTAMPKFVRAALIEARYDYNSSQVWNAFRQVKAENPFETDRGAWEDVVMMISLNDRDAAAKERKMYQDLVIEFSNERQQRIEQAFQKAS
jgi:hypothetical protein